MAGTSGTRRSSSSKAQEKDLVSRLAEAGEEALQRLADLPGGHRALSAFTELRTRVDELGRKVRGLEGLEGRVEKLEKEVEALKRSKPAARRRSTSSTRKSSS